MTILLGIHINTTIYIEYICNIPLILSTPPISKNIRVKVKLGLSGIYGIIDIIGHFRTL